MKRSPPAVLGVTSWRATQKLNKDNLSFMEHISEICRCPDLLTTVVDYRTHVLKISEDHELDSKLTSIPSAKKYKDINRQLSEKDFIKLALLPEQVEEEEGWICIIFFTIFNGRG